MIIRILLIVSSLFFGSPAYAQIETLNQKAAEYRGIWYFIGATKNEYAYKYSGGLGTYPANHYPFSVYAPAVERTFFCYGGLTESGSGELHHLIGYFDHKTSMVSQPTVLLNKRTNDAHDNPVIQLDNQGHIWIFSTSHGTERPSFIHRSRKPYDISTFDRIDATRPLATLPDFYAFWADGDARKPSDSFLYFCNRQGDVFQLPAEMKDDLEKPIPVERR